MNEVLFPLLPLYSFNAYFTLIPKKFNKFFGRSRLVGGKA